MLNLCLTAEDIATVQDIDDVRDKIRRYVEVLEIRRELMELQAKQARMYGESVESRREITEEFARVYFCTEILDEQGMPQGPLAKTLEGISDFPEEVIHWLQVEVYFFLNGVPEEAREYLSQWGFIPALPRPTTSPAQPDVSPAEPSAKPDGLPAATTPSPSSGSPTPTN